MCGHGGGVVADHLTPNQMSAQDRIDALLQELTDLIGPAFDGENDDDPDVSNPVLDGWVLVCAWQDLDTDEGFTTRLGSRGLRAATRSGLLHQALFQFGD